MRYHKRLYRVRGGQITRPDPIRKILGSDWIGLKAKPDWIVIESGKTRSNPKTRSGFFNKKEKEKNLNLNTCTPHTPGRSIGNQFQ